MDFHVITLFPQVCRLYTDSSILGRAQKDKKGKGSKVRGKKIAVNYYNPRDFTEDPHCQVDDRPYGGGPGMVMKALPILRAWQKAVGRKRNKVKIKTLIMSPQGKQFTQECAKRWARKYDHLVLICGRYEGVDHRVKVALEAEEVSVGPYILTGGELPAMIITDATARQLKGVLGSSSSLEDTRPARPVVYTRPAKLKFKGVIHEVPQVLTEGNHLAIKEWNKTVVKNNFQ